MNNITHSELSVNCFFKKILYINVSAYINVCFNQFVFSIFNIDSLSVTINLIKKPMREHRLLSYLKVSTFKFYHFGKKYNFSDSDFVLESFYLWKDLLFFKMKISNSDNFATNSIT